jgi:DHA2 family multidrug resistance protein-like MFS transporter
MGFGLSSKQKMMVAVLLAGTLLAVLNMTLLSPALPHIMNDMRVGATTVQWLTSGYALVEACVIPMNAYLVGRFRTRQLFIGGIAWFAVGSLVAALAPSFPFLLMGRVIQAMATGVVMPMVFTLILLIFPREKRGSAMGIVGLIISFAPAIGPSLSGVLVDSVGWRIMFVIITVLAVAVVVFAVLSLENFKEFDRAPFDMLSTALMLPGMVCLLYSLSSFSSSDNVAMTASLFAAGILLLGLFVWRQLRLETPMLRVQVLKTPQFRTVVILIAVLQASLVGSEVVMPIYVQNVLGQSATTSGLIMLPGALVGAACGVLAGRLFDRYGVRKLAVPGALVLAFGGFMLTTYGMATSVIEVCLVFTVMELGIQFLITPLNTWGVNSLDNRVIQHGNSLSSTTNQVGASFGTALIVSLTGLAGLFAPGADAPTLTYMGTHVAFVGMCTMLALVALGIIAFVRDGKGAKERTEEATGREGIPGVSRPFLVSDVMNPDPLSLRTDSTVRDAMRLIGATETSGVPIVDDGDRITGFVSDGDILKYLSKQSGFYTDGTNYFRLMEDDSFLDRLSDLADLNVMRIATPNVITLDADSDPEDAFKVLSERRIKKAPVVRDGKLVGGLSRRNLIKALNQMEQAQTAWSPR